MKLAIKKPDFDDERAILDDAVDPSVNIFVGNFRDSHIERDVLLILSRRRLVR